MARLASGIRKRPDGKLEKRFTVDGKRYSVYGATNKEIQEKEQQIREEIRDGSYQTNKSLTLDRYFSEWIQNKEKAVKEASAHRYKSIYQRHIKSGLGSQKIREIEKRSITLFLDQLKEEHTEKTCNAVIMVLKMVFLDAVRDEIISRSPAENIRYYKTEKEATNTIHRALTLEEQKAFMDALKDNEHYEFFALLLLTGLRVGEAAALTWKDIDYKNNVIHVTKTITKNADGLTVLGDTTKTKAGTRDIPMTDALRGILNQQRNKYGGAVPFGANQIFYNSFGGFMTSQSANWQIRKTVEKMQQNGNKIERFSVHAFRDTFATRFIEQGGQPQTLKTILGHSSLSMTMDLYAHVLPNTKQEEMNRIQIII